MFNSIFIDIDDTLGDFRGQATKWGVPAWEGSFYTECPTTWTPEQADIQNKTNEAMRDPLFWLTMPLAEGAFELITACVARCYNGVFLLTAVPSALTRKEQTTIKALKTEWAEEFLHFPAERVIVCPRAEKKKYCSPTALLIDDAPRNCAEWAEAHRGARAILHKDCKSSIQALKDLYK